MNEIQSCILSIYESVAKICNEHGLRYYAINGTCLGAVRHGGFIPWDDDMDLAMPIEDFSKFIKVAPSLLPHHLELVYFGTTPSYSHIFIKVADASTTFIEPSEMSDPQRFKGVWLDITPLSAFPGSRHQQILFAEKNKLFGRLAAISKLPINEMGSLKSKLAWLVLHPVVVKRKTDSLDSWLRFLECFPVNEPTAHVSLWSPENPSHMVIPSRCFAGYIDMPFEDVTMRVPIGYDEYLSLQYKHYMELPAPEKRKTHDKGGFIDLQHSYKQYQTGELPLPANL